MKANMIFYIAGTVSFYAAQLLLVASVVTAGLTMVVMGMIFLALGLIFQVRSIHAAKHKSAPLPCVDTVPAAL